ncbi:MAG TPA: DUF4350 domain-containing protein [Candidatus Limnocylindria bacterium]|nr:DUF4350 domain-containing protein [Candidatus Limnocylindria bacterium]
MSGGGRAVRGWVQLAVQLGALLFVACCLQIVADRTNQRFDLTVGKTLTLAPLTRQVLGELEGPLRITVFYDRGNRARYGAVLKRLAAENPRVTPVLYDYDRYLERARSLGVDGYGRAVLEYEGRRVVAPATSEAELAGGILRVVRDRPRRLAYLVGHDERPPGGGGEGYRRLLTALEAENYVIDPVTLADDGVPAATDVVVVAGPQRDLPRVVVERLATYLQGGGSVLLLLDPVPLPNVSALLAPLGITLGDDLVVDPERRILATDGAAAVVEFFKQDNPITGSATRPIDEGVVLPSARTVSADVAPPGVRVESIARTGESAWAMADPERARRGGAPTADDRQGPLDVMVRLELPGPGGHDGRLVVVGDADFASDAYYDLLGNADLALNAIAWLAREDVLAGTREKQIPEVQRPLSPLVLTEAQSRRLLLVLVVVEPAVVLALGAGVVGRRRWRG